MCARAVVLMALDDQQKDADRSECRAEGWPLPSQACWWCFGAGLLPPSQRSWCLFHLRSRLAIECWRSHPITGPIEAILCSWSPWKWQRQLSMESSAPSFVDRHAALLVLESWYIHYVQVYCAENQSWGHLIWKALVVYVYTEWYVNICMLLYLVMADMYGSWRALRPFSADRHETWGWRPRLIIGLNPQKTSRPMTEQENFKGMILITSKRMSAVLHWGSGGVGLGVGVGGGASPEQQRRCTAVADKRSGFPHTRWSWSGQSVAYSVETF